MWDVNTVAKKTFINIVAKWRIYMLVTYSIISADNGLSPVQH